MYPVFESINVIHGEAQHLIYHRQRMQRTAFALWGIQTSYHNLSQAIGALPCSGQWKCKVAYHHEQLDVTMQPYHIQPLQKLLAIEQNDIAYPYKYTDRQVFDSYAHWITPGSDILFLRQGLLTDTMYANVILWDGHQWFTPATPLLQGTKRQFLLDQGLLIERNIMIQDILHYQQISLISAMLNPGDRTLSTQNIFTT